MHHIVHEILLEIESISCHFRLVNITYYYYYLYNIISLVFDDVQDGVMDQCLCLQTDCSYVVFYGAIVFIDRKKDREIGF